MQAVTPVELERDRRVLSRLFNRLMVAGVALASAWGLAMGGRVAALGEVELHLGGLGWALALLHAAVGLALLHPASRRGGAAAMGGLLLGWLAWLGASGRQLEALVPGVLLFLSLRAGAPDDEGPFKPRQRSWVGELAFVGQIAGIGLFARFLLGGLPFLLLAPLAGIWHQRIAAHLGSRQSRAQVVLLYILIYWVGVGGLWSVLGQSWPGHDVGDLLVELPGRSMQREAAGVHLALVVPAFLAFWIRNHLWSVTVGAKALFLYGAALVHLWSSGPPGSTSPGGTGLSGLMVGGLLAPTAMLILVSLVWRQRDRTTGT